MSSVVDLRTQNAANKVHARATPITRRRGACRRCQARKVRCDGKTACSQCQRLGFECRYPPSTRQRRTSVKETGAPTRISLEQLEALGDRSFIPGLTEPTTPQNIGPFLFGDEFDTNRPPGQGDDLQDDVATASAETERSKSIGDFPTDTLDYSFISSQTAFFPEFDFVDEHFDFGTCSHFPPVTDKSDSSKASSLQTRPSGIFDVFPLGGRDSHFGDPICAEKIHQNDLIKGALLRDIQEHCKRQRGPQRGEIARAFGKLISEDSINIYPPLTTLRREAGFRLDKDFALDCIDEQIKACLKDPQGISTFLDRSSLVHLMPEMVEQTPFPPPERALSHIILALGSHILFAQGRHDKIGHFGYDPRTQFSEALKLRPQILERDFSVRNLQALAVMFYFAALTGADETPGLLSNSIQYTQIMRLSRGSAVDDLCETIADRQRTKRAFWFLYSMEKEFCLRAEMFPVLDEDFVDYKPPKLETSPPDAVDWLSIRCCYANLCTAILKAFYGQSSLRAQSSNSMKDLEARLNDWVCSLPPGTQSISEQMVEFPTPSIPWQERAKKLSVFFQYHAVLLKMHTGRRSQQPSSLSCSSDMSDLDPWALECSQKSAAAVQKILAASCQLTASDVRLYPSMYWLVCIATCSLAATTIRNPVAGNRTDLSYLATAAGFFGRMALAKIEGPLEEITEIVRIAQQHIKEKQQDMSTAD